MKSYEFVTEVLDTQAGPKAKWDTRYPEMIDLKFTASNGQHYQLDFVEPSIGPDEMSPYTFFDKMSDQAYDRSRYVSFSLVENPNNWFKQTEKHGIEGTGAAAEVFGIVTNGIIDYARRYRPSMLYFQGAEPSRQRLYARIVPRIAQSLPGWAYRQDGQHFALYNTSYFR